MFKKIIVVGFVLFISGCKPVADESAEDVNSLLKYECIDSQSQCEVSTDLGNFSLKLSQQQLTGRIKTELPFFIELSLFQNHLSQSTEQSNESNTPSKIDNSITNVSAYLEGKDMFMGKVPVFFEQGTNEGIYLAQSLLASCSEEQMVWRLWVTVEVAQKTHTFFIDFTSQRL